jgi:exosortase/archaeosortase family protein
MALKRVVIYLSFVVLITLAFELVPSGWLESLTAESSSIMLRFFGFTAGWRVNDGRAYLNLIGGVRNVNTMIIRECTAIHVFAFFTGLILPLEGGLWFKKLVSLALAGSMLLALNLFRILMTMLLTAYDVPPFTWMFTNPTVEAYHYPLSFIYGVFGVALLVILIDRLTLPELGETLRDVGENVWISLKNGPKRIRACI